MKVIEIKNLDFSYSRQKILKNINFSVYSGDFACITGANGTGKSTLLKLILGNLRPDCGEIRLFGKSVDDISVYRGMGYVAQHGHASAADFPATSFEAVMTNIYPEIGLFRRVKKAHRERAMLALEQVGMADFAGAPLSELSGGQRQRVMIARAIAGNPRLLLLDEPSSGVDPASSEELFLMLRKLSEARGITIYMVSHDTPRCAKYCDRFFCLEEGDLLELSRDSLMHELSHKHRHYYSGT